MPKELVIIDNININLRITPTHCYFKLINKDTWASVVEKEFVISET